jgi:hypothetical protein
MGQVTRCRSLKLDQLYCDTPTEPSGHFAKSQHEMKIPRLRRTHSEPLVTPSIRSVKAAKGSTTRLSGNPILVPGCWKCSRLALETQRASHS